MCGIVRNVMDYEYNELTKELLAAGYTVDNFPDHVKIDTSRLTGDDPLRNLGGGFVYKPRYRDELIYKTGCGLYIKGEHVFDNMSFMGEFWCHENNNPVFICPYDKPDCPNNDERLYGKRGLDHWYTCWCTCHRTEEPYNYEKSIEKANKDVEEERERKYQEFCERRNERVCRNHAFYDKSLGEWDLNYSPSRCRTVCYSQNGYCPILGKQLSKKRGNVYYDLKEIQIPKEQSQISLFRKEEIVTIKKGIRYFDAPCSLDICEAFVKVEKDEIANRFYWENTWRIYLNENYSFEIFNIRAESKPSRDLMQDLADIQAGITVYHDSDDRKREKEYKKQRRTQAQEKRIAKLEKKILEVGYENLEEFSMDKVHADKWLSVERIAELEVIRQEKLKEIKPEQISLFDWMGDE